MPKKGKSEKRKECWTKSTGGGKPYVVCNDPPRGSKGQKGVYQAETPTGKQDGRYARQQAEEKKAIEKRRKAKAKLKDKYPDGIPEGLPTMMTMKNQLTKADKDKVRKLGKAGVYEEWKDTKQGKKWEKLNKEAPDRRRVGQPKDAPEEGRWDKIDSEGRPPVEVMRTDLVVKGIVEHAWRGLNKNALFRLWTKEGFKVLEDGRTGKGKRKTAVTELTNSEMRDYLSTRIANPQFRGKSKKGLFELYIREKKREADDTDDD